MIEVDKIKNKLKTLLSADKYAHSLAVAYTAMKLAKIYNYDKQKAYLAGLIHDSAKDIQIKNYKQYKISRFSIPDYKNLVKYCPGIIHSFASAELAKKIFKIKDKGVLNAARFHAIGRVGMGVLEKIVFISDLIEPERNFFGVEVLRDIADKDLDKAMFSAISCKIEFVLRKKKYLYTQTVQTRNWVLHTANTGSLLRCNSFV